MSTSAVMLAQDEGAMVSVPQDMMMCSLDKFKSGQRVVIGGRQLQD